MRLKYQLRGLGIGMVLTALVMGIASGEGSALSDAEIKARALELGMVEGDSLKLTDVVATAMPESGREPQSATPSGNQGGDSGKIPDLEATPSPADMSSGAEAMSSDVAPTKGPTDEGEGALLPSEGSAEDGMITIVIEPGEIASEICVKLAEAGLIEDAAAFEVYLCENYWSRSIKDGTYAIPVGTSMEDIAGMIVADFNIN